MDSSCFKIAIISHSLGGGGAERFSWILGKLLHGANMQVHHIILIDRVDYDYAGTMLNLGKISASGLSRKYKKAIAIRQYLREHQIQVIIDNRARGSFLRECFFKLFTRGCRRIFMVHSYHLSKYFPPYARLAHFLYGQSTLVTVSEAIATQIEHRYGLQPVTIYNPVIPFNGPETPVPQGNYFLYFGRFDDAVKHFRLLIRAFALSGVYQKGYQLVFLGEGPDHDKIVRYSREAGIEESIVFLPFVHNPAAIVRKAHAAVLTSHFEGFPMSIIESPMLGTPVIAVDCLSGPAEIIKNHHNGLLVPNYDEAALANSFSTFVENQDLYHFCKAQAVSSVAHLSAENILSSWKQILQHQE